MDARREGWKYSYDGPTLGNGMRNVILMDKGAKAPNLVKIKLKAAGGLYAMGSSYVPMHAIVTFGDTAAADAGLCAETAFVITDCRLAGPTSTRCRASTSHGVVRIMPTRTLLIAVILVATTASWASADVELTTCGQAVAADSTAFLTADLDCSAYAGSGVMLGSGAQLELRGFSLIGNPSATAQTRSCAPGHAPSWAQGRSVTSRATASRRRGACRLRT
jgi:hypothetical protein